MIFIGRYNDNSPFGEPPRHDRVKNHVQRPVNKYAHIVTNHRSTVEIKPNILSFVPKCLSFYKHTVFCFGRRLSLMF